MKYLDWIKENRVLVAALFIIAIAINLLAIFLIDSTNKTNAAQLEYCQTQGYRYVAHYNELYCCNVSDGKTILGIEYFSNCTKANVSVSYG